MASCPLSNSYEVKANRLELGDSIPPANTTEADLQSGSNACARVCSLLEGDGYDFYPITTKRSK
jgi:hypothetical protein